MRKERLFTGLLVCDGILVLMNTGEGLESGEFSECREYLEILKQEYSQMETMTQVDKTE